MNIEELIDEISDIKKQLISFEEALRESDELNEDEFKCLYRYKENAYEELIRIKDFLEVVAYKKSGGEL